jgi:hypothetical protein
MPAMFEPYLVPGGGDQMRMEIENAKLPMDRILEAIDAELPSIDAENAQGDGAKELAAIWSHKDGLGDYKTTFDVDRIRPYLPQAILEFAAQHRTRRIIGDRDSVYGSSEDDEGGSQETAWRRAVLGMDSSTSRSSPEGKSVLLLEPYSLSDEERTLDIQMTAQISGADGDEAEYPPSTKDGSHLTVVETLQADATLKRKRSSEVSQKIVPKRRHTTSTLQPSRSEQLDPSSILLQQTSETKTKPLTSLQGIKVTPETLAKAMDLKARIAAAAKARNRSKSPIKKAENGATSKSSASDLLSRRSSTFTLPVQDSIISSSNPSLNLSTSDATSAVESDRNNLSSSSIEDLLRQSADLERARSLLDGLIHKKTDWPSFTSIESQAE